MPYQAEIWFAITAGAIVGAIAGGAIVSLSKVKEAREAKRSGIIAAIFHRPGLLKSKRRASSSRMRADRSSANAVSGTS
jgi:hypothetical protein